MRFFMRFLQGTLLAFTLGVSACSSVVPTPILMGRVDTLNEEVNQLYLDCSNGANFVPDLENCVPDVLETKTIDLLNLSIELIRADIRQPQGYDIHLAISLIYFRIAQRNEAAYTRAEMIARQFFEMQKASGRGRSLNIARYYWAHFTAAHGSWQYYYAIEKLDFDRKTDFFSALAEGSIAISHTEGIRLIRLKQALKILENLASFID